jgi:hypothetical protein
MAHQNRRMTSVSGGYARTLYHFRPLKTYQIAIFGFPKTTDS